MNVLNIPYKPNQDLLFYYILFMNTSEGSGLEMNIDESGSSFS